MTLIAAGFTTVDQPYLAMDYMPNGSLADRIDRDGRVPWSEAATIVAKLADAAGGRATPWASSTATSVPRTCSSRPW